MRRSHKVLLLTSLIGAMSGYLIVAPVAMGFFHLSHAGLGDHLYHHLRQPILEAMLDSFRPDMALWAGGFVVLGSAFGVAVGCVLAVLISRQRAITQRAAELMHANRKLDEALRRLIEADKMSMLGVFSGMFVHDLRNHLCSLNLIAAEHCAKPPTSSGEPEDDWQLVAREVGRMRELADSIMRFSRRPVSAGSTANLHDAIKESLALLKRGFTGAGISVHTRLAARDGHVRADASDLVHVLLNLGSNAIHAMPKGGTFGLATSDTEDGVVLEVSDSGAGMTAETLEHAFDLFFTTKSAEQGTGLGLPVSKEIIERAGGRIRIESRLGNGTRVVVSLPRPVPAFSTAKTPGEHEAERDAKGSLPILNAPEPT